jgi:carbonic anhydrase
MNPQIAIDKLKQGNERFISGVRAVEPLLSHGKMKELSEKGQKPFAIVLTCSDSRSPVEMIFDQGIGDLFVVRVAGNVVAPSLLASIEFAAKTFGSSTIVVLGHTLCGAVSATLQHVKNPADALPSEHLEELLSRIRPAVELVVAGKTSSDKDALEKSIAANIERSKRLILSQSAIVQGLHKEGKLSIVGALLDISNGKVTFLD